MNKPTFESAFAFYTSRAIRHPVFRYLYKRRPDEKCTKHSYIPSDTYKSPSFISAGSLLRNERYRRPLCSNVIINYTLFSYRRRCASRIVTQHGPTTQRGLACPLPDAGSRPRLLSMFIRCTAAKIVSLEKAASVLS